MPELVGARRLASWLAAVLLLAGCAGQGVWAPQARVDAARYAHGGAPSLSLVTVISYRSGRGEHTGLFINGAQRVLFDPAGSWAIDTVPERNDVHFGMTPRMVDSYYRSHTRETHYTVVQRIPLTPAVAAQAMRLARAAGPVAPAFCARATSRLLAGLPGFGEVTQTFWPRALMKQLAARDDVITHELHHDAPDFRARIKAAQAPL